MQTEAVLTRYRELKKEGLSALEASVQVHQEAGKTGQVHWHRIHERCWCGYLTVPAAYYTYDDKGRQTNTQAQAETAYEKDRTETPRTESPTGNKRTGRPKKWASEAERLKAYRERSRG